MKNQEFKNKLKTTVNPNITNSNTTELLKALGLFPLPENVEVTPGTVKQMDTVMNGVMTVTMTGTISDGYSGGPMVDEDGNVIGIAWGSDENQSFATASQEFIAVIKTVGIDYTSSDGSATVPETSEEEGDNSPAAEETIDVPDVVGMSQAEAVSAVESLGLKADVSGQTVASDEIEADCVVSSNPPKGTKVEKDSTVTLTISSGKESSIKSILPFVIGGLGVVILLGILAAVLLTRKKNTPPSPTGVTFTEGPSSVNPATGSNAQGSAPPVPPAGPVGYAGGNTPDTSVLNQGSNETTVLGQGAGETSVLSSTQTNGSLTRSKTGEKINITRENFKIGRERSRVDYCISDNTAVGRHHATIVVRNGEAYLIDQNSRNFTFINDVKVTPNMETKLQEGDKVCFADEVFTYHAR